MNWEGEGGGGGLNGMLQCSSHLEQMKCNVTLYIKGGCVSVCVCVYVCVCVCVCVSVCVYVDLTVEGDCVCPV